MFIPMGNILITMLLHMKHVVKLWIGANTLVNLRQNCLVFVLIYAILMRKAFSR